MSGFFLHITSSTKTACVEPLLVLGREGKADDRKDTDKAVIVLPAGKEHTFELGPFAVVVFDAKPF
jgi:hypothetical protein